MSTEYPTDVHALGAQSPTLSQNDETVTNVISQELYVNTENGVPVTPSVTPSVTDAVTAECDGSAPAKAAENLAVTGVTANPLQGSLPEDGADLLDEITEAIQRYVVLSLAEAQ